MTTLASTADYEAITGQTLDDAELARVSRLLGMASEAVLAGAHGQLIAEDTYEDVALRPFQGLVYLPQRPVTALASVVVDGETVDPDLYRWEPGGDGRPALLIAVDTDGADSGWSATTVTVTYTAGWATVPAQIIAATVAVARGAYMGSADTVLTATAAGAFVPEYPGSNLNLVALKLTPAVQSVVDQVCKVRPPGSVELTRG